jgi:hypothetical protein
LRYSDNLGEQHVELCREIDLLRNGKRFTFPYRHVQMRISKEGDRYLRTMLVHQRKSQASCGFQGCAGEVSSASSRGNVAAKIA